METKVGWGWKGVTGAGVTCLTSFDGLSPRLKGLRLFLQPPTHPSLFLLFPLALDLTLGRVTRPDSAPPTPRLTELFSVGGTLELLVTMVTGQDPAGRDGLVHTRSAGEEASCTQSFLSISGPGGLVLGQHHHRVTKQGPQASGHQTQAGSDGGEGHLL